MIYKEQHIEYLETLPLKANKTAYYSEIDNANYGRKYKRRKRNQTPERNPRCLARFILKKYLNKAFANMYREWSEKIKHSDRLRKHKYVMKDELFSNFRFRWLDRHYEHHYVDNNGIVRLIEKSHGR
ncbi:MAG: hypothetical protein LBU83_01560 [Bacteroidales bacterium]|jgi:N-acetylmuramoyl-L-alanine amidase CwlA|nr:hypothetical protein [Bacteroidales bacterium]